MTVASLRRALSNAEKLGLGEARITCTVTNRPLLSGSVLYHFTDLQVIHLGSSLAEHAATLATDYDIELIGEPL